jgi:acyl transferase domain-containing protein
MTHTNKRMNKIAIVGMFGIFSQADNTEQFIKNIYEKKEAVIAVPEGRWPVPSSDMVTKRYLPDKTSSSRAGLITIFNFDPNGFLIDKDLLTGLDPIHKLLLNAGRNAFEGYFQTPELKKTGVILAAISLPTDQSSLVSWYVLCQKNKNRLHRQTFQMQRLFLFHRL